MPPIDSPSSSSPHLRNTTRSLSAFFPSRSGTGSWSFLAPLTPAADLFWSRHLRLAFAPFAFCFLCLPSLFPGLATCRPPPESFDFGAHTSPKPSLPVRSSTIEARKVPLPASLCCGLLTGPRRRFESEGYVSSHNCRGRSPLTLLRRSFLSSPCSPISRFLFLSVPKHRYLAILPRPLRPRRLTSRE